MKKNSLKLDVKKSTLRNLSEQDLKNTVGGLVTTTGQATRFCNSVTALTTKGDP